MFIHGSEVSGHPLGAWWPKIGWPSRETSCAVRGVGSGGASSARIVLTTTSNGDFTLARNAAREKNSGEVTMVRTTSRMSPSVRMYVAAARSTSACGGWSLTKRTASFRAMNLAVDG